MNHRAPGGAPFARGRGRLPGVASTRCCLGSVALAVVAAWLAVGSASGALAQDMPAQADFEEAPIDFRYKHVGDVTVIAAYRDGEFYLPVGALFRLLLINHRLDPRVGRVEGHYLDGANVYVIDAASGSTEVAGHRLEFGSGSFIVGDLEIYAHPLVLEEAFALAFTIQMETLRLSLRTHHTLPVEVRHEWMRRANLLGEEDLDRPHALLRHDRHWRLLSGGAIDYSVRSMASQHGLLHAAGLRGGLELLGGEFTFSAASLFSDKGTSLVVGSPQQRWVFRDNAALTEFEVGVMQSGFISKRAFRGVRFTNRPVEPRRLLGSMRLREDVAPGSYVEVYRDQRLVRALTIGDDGVLDLALPVRYGTSDYSVRLFGPDGAVRELAYRLPVPPAFLPAGEMEYQVELGQMDSLGTLRPDATFGRVVAAYGATDWLTFGFGGDVTRRAGRHLGIGAAQTTSARFLGSHLASIEVHTTGAARFGVQGYYSNHAFWAVEWTRGIVDDPLSDYHAYAHELRARLYLPVLSGRLPLTLRTQVDQRWFDDRDPYSRLRLSLDGRLGGLRTTAGYRNAPIPFLGHAPAGTALVPEVFLEQAGGLGWARGLVGSWLSQVHVRHALAVDAASGALREWSGGLTRQLGRNSRLAISGSHRFHAQGFGFEIQFARLFPSTFATTDVRKVGSDTRVTQSVRGGIGFSHEMVGPYFDRGSLVGQGGVILRPFVDRSGTGRFDPGDIPIREDIIRFRQPVLRYHDRESGVLRVSGLRAHSRYSVDIDLDRVRNPLWLPAHRSFSFVTDPSRYKVIDVPFYVAGVVEGTVRRTDREGRPAGVAGLRVQVVGLDTDFAMEATTFSDGSYYLMGLPPGEYEARADADHLEILGLLAESGPVPFRVRVTDDGDFVSGVDLVLVRAAP